MLVNWVKFFGCIVGIRKLSICGSGRVGGLCWSVIYWDVVFFSFVSLKLIFIIVLVKLV